MSLNLSSLACVSVLGLNVKIGLDLSVSAAAWGLCGLWKVPEASPFLTMKAEGLVPLSEVL